MQIDSCLRSHIVVIYRIVRRAKMFYSIWSLVSPLAPLFSAASMTLRGAGSEFVSISRPLTVLRPATEAAKTKNVNNFDLHILVSVMQKVLKEVITYTSNVSLADVIDSSLRSLPFIKITKVFTLDKAQTLSSH